VHGGRTSSAAAVPAQLHFARGAPLSSGQALLVKPSELHFLLNQRCAQIGATGAVLSCNHTQLHSTGKHNVSYRDAAARWDHR
jgi:hypothetical protein